MVASEYPNIIRQLILIGAPGLGIFGKELVVGTLKTFYGADGTDPEAAMLSAFDGKIGAFAYLLFVLIYMPCVAAVAASRAI